MAERMVLARKEVSGGASGHALNVRAAKKYVQRINSPYKTHRNTYLFPPWRNK